MAEWAERCIRQGGLVVMPHAPNPQAERAADIVLGLVHAIEMMTFNPYDAQVNPYGLADWYRFLNLGYQIPLVGGSDKMAASSLLGGIRTYAHLGERDFTYEHWMEAVRAGNTFVTVGPLIEFSVDGQPAGQPRRASRPVAARSTSPGRSSRSTSRSPRSRSSSAGWSPSRSTRGNALSASGSASVRDRPIRPGSRCACAAATTAARATSPPTPARVQIVVGEQPLFVETDAMAVLEQIEGAIAYVDTLAPRPEAQRYKQLRATLESAHNRLHQRLHQQGIFHRHTPLHGHDAAGSIETVWRDLLRAAILRQPRAARAPRSRPRRSSRGTACSARIPKRCCAARYERQPETPFRLTSHASGLASRHANDADPGRRRRGQAQGRIAPRRPSIPRRRQRDVAPRAGEPA